MRRITQTARIAVASSFAGELILATAIGGLTACGSIHSRERTLDMKFGSPLKPPAHDSFFVDSRPLGERRLINVHTPLAYHNEAQPRRRFPVLYMPDGGLQEDFPHIVRAVDSLTSAGAIPPTIVVGIPNTERRRDLTGPTRFASDSAIAPHVGGSAAFRAFIREELIHEVDVRYRTTGERAIIGESLAGLFIVETFLRDAGLFDRYAAFDPSLWWNHDALVDSASALLAGKTPQSNARLFIAASRDGIGDQMTRFVSAFAGGAPPSVTWRFEGHPGLTHANIFSKLEIAALSFLLERDFK